MVVWNSYYQHFQIEPDAIRLGCEPQIMIPDQPSTKAIVLIHGLTDSPFFMKAIGEYFFKWGYNVLIPLLDGHGLKNPQKLKGISLKKWINNVDFAIQEAQDRYQSQVISIGGLSAGGALSVLKMFDSPQDITGGVFLFSAALDIGSVAGDFIEKLLRTPIISPILANLEDEFSQDLIGDNPYRYSRMDNDGAKELSKLIKEIDYYIQNHQQNNLNQPIFVAHSEDDSAADIRALEELIANSKHGKTEFFRIGQNFHVSHANIVLKEDLFANNGSPLEPKNPVFKQMMNVAYRFQKQYL